MLTAYIRAAMQHAQYETLEDDGTYYGEIPELPGVWANAATIEECQAELQATLEDWMVFRIANGFELPAIDGIELNAARVA